MDEGPDEAGTLRGHVELVLGAGAAPRSVAVELHLVAVGEVGSVAVAERVELDALRAGGAADFSLTAPTLPAPFVGTRFRIETRVAVVLDAVEGDAKGCAAARAYPLATATVTVPRAPLRVAAARLAGRTVRLGAGVGLALGAALTAGGLGLLGVLFTTNNAVAAISSGVTAFLLLLVGGMFVHGSFPNVRASHGFGPVSWSVAAQGDGTRVTVRLREGARISRVGFTVCVHESVQVPVSGGDMPSGEDAPVATRAFDLAPVGPGQWAALLPASALADLPASIDLNAHHIYWQGEIAVVTASGFTWRQSALLSAFPGERWRPRATLSFTSRDTTA